MPTLSITGLPDKAAAVDLEFFIGDDETVEYQPTEDATGWQLRFAVRKTVNAAAALIQLVPIVSGVFPAQTVDIFIADDKTAILKAGAYFVGALAHRRRRHARPGMGSAAPAAGDIESAVAADYR